MGALGDHHGLGQPGYRGDRQRRRDRPAAAIRPSQPWASARRPRARSPLSIAGSMVSAVGHGGVRWPSPARKSETDRAAPAISTCGTTVTETIVERAFRPKRSAASSCKRPQQNRAWHDQGLHGDHRGRHRQRHHRRRQDRAEGEEDLDQGGRASRISWEVAAILNLTPGIRRRSSAS